MDMCQSHLRPPFHFNQTVRAECLDPPFSFLAPVHFVLPQMHWVREYHSNHPIPHVHDRLRGAIHWKLVAEVLRIEGWSRTGNVE